MRLVTMCALAALILTGCGGSDATGPSNASVAGTWSFSASNMSGQGVSCGMNPSPLTISQSGTTFTGSYGPGTVTCVAGSQSVSTNIQGTIVNGTVDGSAVSFDMDTQDYHHIGSVSGNSMSGTARWTFDLGGTTGVVILNGNWSAARQ